jgi:hypothetical protein
MTVLRSTWSPCPRHRIEPRDQAVEHHSLALLASIGGARPAIECRSTKRRHGAPGDPATIRRSVRARAKRPTWRFSAISWWRSTETSTLVVWVWN